MKVYELMQKLADAPSGAEIDVRRLMTLKDFTDCEIVDTAEGADLYSVSGSITSMEGDTDYVTLYFGMA